jgi:hypothetical protein
MGTSEIEVLDSLGVEGIKTGDEIVTGSYKALRTLKPETKVRIDNSAPKKEEEQP